MEVKVTSIKGDITKVKADAIVNAANSSLLGGGGVDGAIHRAGGPAILEECKQIRNRQGGCMTGEAVITTAGNLPARFVIHTVGPVWNNNSETTDPLLANCYRNSLKIAAGIDLASVAFPNISTGIYGYPKKIAAEIAIATVRDFFSGNQGSSSPDKIKDIIFVCFDEENYQIYNSLLTFKSIVINPSNK